jgi:Protein of unknown function (DUF4446)
MVLGNLYAAAAALGGALVALLLYHVTVVRPSLGRMRRLLELHDELITGGGAGAADRLGDLAHAQASHRSALEGLTRRLEDLQTLSKSDLSRVGFVRYDAFTDNEAGLSYALALLNRNGDGVVLTSIYSRTDTRTFGKPVESFKPTVHASTEELEAIERARPPAS